MKKLILLWVLLIYMIGCNLFYDYEYKWQIPEDIHTIDMALDHLSRYEYVPKYGTTFLPHELYDYGYGDCGDFTLMLQYLFETQLGLTADYIIGRYDDDTVYFHAWVESNGKLYESTNGREVSEASFSLYEPMYRYAYPESVEMVMEYGGFLEDSRGYEY